MAPSGPAPQIVSKEMSRSSPVAARISSSLPDHVDLGQPALGRRAGRARPGTPPSPRRRAGARRGRRRSRPRSCIALGRMQGSRSQTTSRRRRCGETVRDPGRRAGLVDRHPAAQRVEAGAEGLRRRAPCTSGPRCARSAGVDLGRVGEEIDARRRRAGSRRRAAPGCGRCPSRGRSAARRSNRAASARPRRGRARPGPRRSRRACRRSRGRRARPGAARSAAPAAAAGPARRGRPGWRPGPGRSAAARAPRSAPRSPARCAARDRSRGGRRRAAPRSASRRACPRGWRSTVEAVEVDLARTCSR